MTAFRVALVVAFIALCALVVPAAKAAAARALCAAPASKAANVPRTLVYSGPQLVAVKERLAAGDAALMPAYCQTIRAADNYLPEKPLTILDGTKVLEGCDAQDFLSQSPAAWPDPTKPKGLPWTITALKVNPDSTVGTDLSAWLETSSRIHTLGIAYFFSGNEAYAAQAAKLARIWFLDPATRMNPNTRCEGVIPGVPPKGSSFTGRHIMRVAEGLALIAGSPSWTAADDKAFKAWVASYLDWATKEPPAGGAHTATQPSNVGVFHDAQLIYYALYTGRNDLARRVAEQAKERRIASRISPSGELPNETQRYNGWGYSLLSLNGLLTLAKLSEHAGVNLLDFQTPDGRSLRKGVGYLVSYAKAPASWPHKGKPETSAVFAEVLALYTSSRPDPELEGLLATLDEKNAAQQWQLLYPRASQVRPR